MLGAARSDVIYSVLMHVVTDSLNGTADSRGVCYNLHHCLGRVHICPVQKAGLGEVSTFESLLKGRNV